MKKIILGILIGIIAVATSVVFANSSYFPLSTACQTASATTTLSYMTAGTATTTVTCDSFTLNSGYPDNRAVDSAVLAIQLTASSTVTVLDTNFEYSVDGIDWYQDNLSERSTTTPTQSITTSNKVSWTFASSTPGLGAVRTNTNRNHKVITVQTPARYVRAVFTLPTGSANAGVWAGFINKRENQ